MFGDDQLAHDAFSVPGILAEARTNGVALPPILPVERTRAGSTSAAKKADPADCLEGNLANLRTRLHCRHARASVAQAGIQPAFGQMARSTWLPAFAGRPSTSSGSPTAGQSMPEKGMAAIHPLQSPPYPFLFRKMNSTRFLLGYIGCSSTTHHPLGCICRDVPGRPSAMSQHICSTPCAERRCQEK